MNVQRWRGSGAHRYRAMWRRLGAYFGPKERGKWVYTRASAYCCAVFLANAIRAFPLGDRYGGLRGLVLWRRQ